MEDYGKYAGKWGDLKMNDFIDLIKGYDDFAELGGVDEGSIIEAETKLGLKFAADYRLFIKTCGAACANGHEFLGICDSKRLNIVDSTLKSKKNNPQIEDDMYLIENVGIDKIRVWQNSKGDLFQSVEKGKPEKLDYGLSEYLKS